MSDVKPSTVAEIKAANPDSVVYCFIGTIKSRGARTTGTNNYGDWSFETVQLQDATGDVITGKIVDCPPLDPKFAAGVGVSILAVHSQKNGWTGAKAKADKKKGSDPTNRVLWITQSAVWNVQASPKGQSGTPQRQSEPSSGDPEPSSGDPEPSSGDPEPSSGDPVQDAITLICKLDNLERLCLRATHRLADDFKAAFGRPMDDALFQSINSSYFIRCKDQGVYLDFPIKPIPMNKGSK